MSANSERKKPSTGYALLVLAGVLVIVLGAVDLSNVYALVVQLPGD